MDLVDPSIEAYLRDLQPSPDAVLQQMRLAGERRGFPIIGPLVGRLCEQLARGVGARRVFELGSGFGYSTAWFARAVGPRGKVVHTETDAGLQVEARGWLRKGRLERRVDFRLGDARDLLRADRRLNDVVFCDIDKEGYVEAWRLARARVRVGGLVVTDNTLWHGKVLRKARDEATAAVQEYNHLAFADARFLSTLMPVRDGVTVSLRLR
jgi:caffeoyl-CoA O-methyltransferase